MQSFSGPAAEPKEEPGKGDPATFWVWANTTNVFHVVVFLKLLNITSILVGLLLCSFLYDPPFSS